jgi:hypothetical protein
MNVDTGQVRQCLKSFDFKRLFIQELNWSHCTNRPLDLEIDGDIARISPFAELGGVVVYQVELISSSGVPSAMVRRQIENKIKQLTHEHVNIFVDSEKSKSVWHGSGAVLASKQLPVNILTIETNPVILLWLNWMESPLIYQSWTQMGMAM